MNTSAPLIPGSGNFSAVEVTDYIFTELILNELQSNTITTSELVCGNINITSVGISGLLDPVLPQDISTKNYIDSFTSTINYLTDGCVLLKGTTTPFNQSSNFTYSNNTLQVPTIETLQVKTNNLSFYTTGPTLSILQNPLSSVLNFILPVSYGLSGQVIKTDGSGNLSFDEQITPDGPNYSLQYNNNGYGFTGSDNLKFQNGTLSVSAPIESNFMSATTLHTMSFSNNSSLFNLSATSVGTSSTSFVFNSSGLTGSDLLFESDGSNNISYVSPNAVVPSSINNSIQYYTPGPGLASSNNLLWTTSGLLITAGINQIAPGTSTMPTTMATVFGIQNSRYSQVYNSYEFVIDDTSTSPSTLTVINIEDPFNTFLVTRRIIDNYNCIGMSIINTNLFIFFTRDDAITPESTILIYSIINPSSPVLITTFTYSDNTIVFNVTSNYIYIQVYNSFIEQRGRLAIIDITDIYNPEIISEYQFTQSGIAQFNAITSFNDYIYMTSLVVDELFIFNATNPFSPSIMSQTSLLHSAGNIRLFIEYPYLFSVTYDGWMEIVDISSNAGPIYVTNTSLSTQCIDSMYDSNYIFTVLSGSSSQYIVVDWNNLVTPTTYGYNSYLSYNLPFDPVDGSGQFLNSFSNNSTNNLCVLSSDSINIFDQSTISSEVFINDYSYINKPNQIVINEYSTYVSNVADNSITFIGPGPAFEQLYKLYFSRDVGFTVNQNTISFEIEGNFVFSISNYTFNIIELSPNPYASTPVPVISGAITLPNPLFSLSLSPDYAFVSSLHVVYKINTMNYTQPYTSSTITIVDNINTTLIANNTLFVACDASLKVYSLDLVQLQSLSFGGTDINMLSSNNYLYTYSGNDFLQYDINTPSNIYLVTQSTLNVTATSMFMTGNYLYVSLNDGSINTYAVGTGELIGSTTSGISSCLTVSGHKLYSASPNNKIYIMNPYGMNMSSCFIPNISCAYVDITGNALLNSLNVRGGITCDTLVTNTLTLTSKQNTSIANFGTTTIGLTIPNNLTIDDCTLAANTQVTITVTGSGVELSRNITAVVNKHTGNGLPIVVVQNRLVNTSSFNLIIYNRASVTMTGVLVVSLFGC